MASSARRPTGADIQAFSLERNERGVQAKWVER